MSKKNDIIVTDGIYRPARQEGAYVSPVVRQLVKKINRLESPNAHLTDDERTAFLKEGAR